MARDFKRKTTQQSWDQASMEKAIEAVREKEMGLRQAATQFGVPLATLYRRVKRTGDPHQCAQKGLGRYR